MHSSMMTTAMVSKVSPFSLKMNTREIRAFPSDLREWFETSSKPNRRGIQQVFPYLNAEDREIFKDSED
jgi:hypothetical protein